MLNSIGEKIILDSHWFMKDEEAIDWREKNFKLLLHKENKFKEGSWEAYQKGEWYLMCFF
jgi:hypothetical protein